VFEPLVWCCKGIWVHTYTIPPAKFAPDLEILCCLCSENDAITSCLTMTSTSDRLPHSYLTSTKCLSHWYAVSRAHGCTLIPFHWPSWPQIWEFCVPYGVELMPLHHGWGWHPKKLLRASILDICKVFEPPPLVCCLNGIWVHPHTIPEPNWPQIWEFWVPYGVEMMPLQNGWGWCSPQTAYHIHFRNVQSVWAFGMMLQGHMGAYLYHSTRQVDSRFGNSVLLM
jgi:hypothetical protein